ncbi:pyruvate ferredoxin oxidoreductase [Candidatus Woesearchaeota archaeon]|nr:pyruvate ferredoxin oxidoreductase [Candidatus Woesearchaeota archaeon]
MIEIKCIGRGGQGAVTFSQILAIAAFEQGYPVVQAMPTFGVERRGAPSFSFTRISKEQCFGIRSQIYTPDIVIVLDPSLMKDIDVIEGLKKKGIVIINTSQPVKKLGIKNFEVHTADASTVALKLFGRDIVNTAMLGAFAAATKLVSLESLYKGVEQRFEGKQKLIDLNKQAIKEVYNKLK